MKRRKKNLGGKRFSRSKIWIWMGSLSLLLSLCRLFVFRQNTPTHTLSLPLSHTLKHTLFSFSYTHTHRHKGTQSDTHFHSLSLAFTQAHTHTQIFSHTHAHTFPLSLYANSLYTRTHRNTHAIFPCFSLSLLHTPTRLLPFDLPLMGKNLRKSLYSKKYFKYQNFSTFLRKRERRGLANGWIDRISLSKSHSCTFGRKKIEYALIFTRSCFNEPEKVFFKYFISYGVPHLTTCTCFAYFSTINHNWQQKSILAWLWPHFHLVYWMRRDLNPQPFDCELTLLTTRPDCRLSCNSAHWGLRPWYKK